MKKFKNFMPYALLLSAILFVVACGKDGAVGPAGPAGADGKTGAQGPAGSQGSKGDTGTANVIYSAWLDQAFAPFTDTAANGRVDTTGWYSVIQASRLTAAMLGKCDVHVYMNVNTPTQPVIVSLPNYDYFNIGFDLRVGGIVMQSSIKASTFTYQGEKVLQYRYIIIPGAVAARGAIDWNNYEQAKAYLKLVD
ncbi:collagen-like protein [Chitinophaga sp. Cy-1792]|uniref:collagen-like triple helix repeat-containing protein n=1 Tax=Chitinophaga sp. Cy-1792 TaxID=2608339 RepID=UPI00141E69F1|nr:collagen-like protein [Chitinophaga sp. Cy-1792]NIG55477.1 collagen-like protein [Chitinophaga sp. Cy-1792]